jgi:nucleoside-specific outer membrane channel protein Tsx
MNKNSMKKLSIILAFLAVPFLGFSQENGSGNWLVYIGSKQLNSKWNLHHEIQYRNYNTIGNLEQLLLRTGLGYKVGEKSNLLLGYGYINSENYTGNEDDKVTVEEHRIFQQFITKHTIGKLSLQHRYRFEQRFVASDFKTRFRYFLGLNIPFKDSKYYLSSYNEIFLNGASNVFDRNRVYGGLGYKVSEGIKLEVGYMNQIFETSSRDQINLITFINF